jgi:DNA-binding NtrC family response regulator
MWRALHSLFESFISRPSSNAAARLGIVALGVVDQNRSLLENVAARNTWDVHFADTCAEAWEILNRLKAPVILCDRDLAGTEWRDVVQRMASAPHKACTILLSRVVDDYLWNEVIGKGGYDVLPKPLREEDVVRSVKLAGSYWNTARNHP